MYDLNVLSASFKNPFIKVAPFCFTVSSFIHLLCAVGRLGVGKMKMGKSPALQDLIAHIIRQEG